MTRLLSNCFLVLLIAGFVASGSLQAQVTWDTAGNGNWQDGFNWSTGTVPGAADDVTIDQGGGLLITLGSGTNPINTLFSEEDLSLEQNINLIMAMGGTSNGALTLGVNSDLTSNGGIFTANGTTVLDGGNLFADGGTTMDLSGVTSYLTDTGTNDSRTFRASNSSTLNLSGMTDISGGGFIRTLAVQANSGSLVDLSNFTAHVGGSLRFESDAVSVIDISSLGTFNHTNGSQSRVFATDGGIINAGAMATVQGTGGNSVWMLVDGATSSLNVGALTDVINTRIELRNGGSITSSNFTIFTGSDAIVNDGLTLDMTGVTTYDVNGGGNSGRVFQANGAATLDFSNLTDIQGGTFIRRLEVDANDGSNIDMSGFVNHLGGSIRFDANGVGSLIDISSIAAMNMNDGSQGGLIVGAGGTINANALPSLQGTGGNSILMQVDGATSTLNIASLTDVINTRVRVTNGGTLSSSNFTTFTGSDAVADNSTSLDLTGVTAYDVNGGGNSSRLFQANNSSSIDLSNLTDLQGGTFIRTLNVQANGGSMIDMSGVNNYLGGSTRFQADGVGSSIDVTSITNFDNNNGSQGGLIVSNGGTINATSMTSIGSAGNAGALLQVNGATSTLNVGALTSATNTRVQLTNGGTLASTSGITTFTGSDALADSGVTLDLTGVISYDTNGGGNGDRLIAADGAGSVVDLSNVTNVVGGGFIRQLNVDSRNGGLVDLSGVTNITSGAVLFTSDGAGSQIDVSALQNFMDDNSGQISHFHAMNSGQINLGAASTSVLSDVSLVVDTGGQVFATEIELISTNSADPGTTSFLMGDGGIVVADVLNTSGILAPGASPGALTIDGDYTQGAAGIYAVEIDGLAMFDLLSVTGNADLNGLLSVALDAGFDLGANMDFIVMDIGGIRSGTFSGLGQGAVVLSDAGFDLRIDYRGGDGNDVLLTTNAVTIPEPGSLALLTLAITGVAMRRRQRAA